MARSKEEELFDGRIPFETPKPLKLINQLIKAGSSSHDTVLDFFSGSATTAHAVMQLKAEDGWHRKFIKDKAPTARLGFEVRGETGIRTVV